MFSSLSIDASFLKSLESDNSYISGLSDNEAIDLMKNSAKVILKSDLRFEFRLVNESTDTKLDAIINKFETNFKTALTYLQLHLHYVNASYSDMDFGIYKADYYNRLYKAEKAKWSAFDTGYNITRIVNVSR